jgi:hypothetical protein
MTGPINLYTTHGPGSALTPTALNWGGDAAAPALYYNNGLANNNFNTVVSANQIDICAGWPNDNVYSDLVFTAPTSGSYSAVGSFQGDQYGIDVNVGVLGNGKSLFSSNINSEGTLAPFNTSVSLTAGEQIVFYSTNVGGTQNTGFDVNITSNSVAVPEPSISLLLGMGLAGVGAMRWKFSR